MNARSKAMLYNQTLNVGWSLLSFLPIIYFWYSCMAMTDLYVIGIPALLAFFLPSRFFDAISLGSNTIIYKKLGVKWARQLTQDGDLVNRLIRQQSPGYSVVNDSRSMAAQLNKSYVNETFHFGVFIFFLLTSIDALVRGYVGWFITLTGINIFYNVYPILIQQYNRLRIRALLEKRAGRSRQLTGRQ